jgi:hypothetical protein
VELKEYINIELVNIERNVKRVLNNLTQDELMWRPACGCNSIGLILFHITRSEDSLIHSCFKEKSQVWETGKWFKKLNMAENETGSRYTIEQVNTFQMPNLEDNLVYYTAVRAQTLEYLNSMDNAGFDRKFTMPYWGEIPIAMLFFIVVMHTSEHIGEISYLRGLQRGMDK